MGGYGGAAIAKAGVGALILSGWVKPILFIFLSPAARDGARRSALTVALSWLCSGAAPDRWTSAFRRLQLLSAALYSLSHGANDAQKTMGIIVGLLVATQALFVGADRGGCSHLYLPTADHIPLWVELAAYIAIALGTALGGWRIVKTMGTRITKLRPFGGFCAETAGGISDAHRHGSRRSGQHDAHHHRRHRRRRGQPAAVGGALGGGDADRLGLDSDDPDERRRSRR